jgi:Arylsulfotransferase (ASST)
LLALLAIVVTLASCGPDNSAPTGEPQCGTVPYRSNTGNVTPTPILDSSQVWSFVSEPNLHPNKVTINVDEPGTSSGLVFVDPFTPSSVAVFGQPGALILDNNGTPYWFRPLSSPNLMINDFRMQQLNGNPVLTFWQGTIATPPTYTNIPGGGSEPGGCYYVMDNTYHVIKTLTAHRGFAANFHDFVITPDNTALFVSSKTVPMDLTPYGGPKHGYIYDFAIQEVDLRTDQLLFLWDGLDHIPLTDSFEDVSDAAETNNVWDAYHLNSVGLTDDPEEILVSGRSTSTIYRIDKQTGAIVWQLGGKRSDFVIESGAQFSWQHDARWLPNDMVSLFDDGCCETQTVPPDTPFSHGLTLQLDFSTMTARTASEYYHDPNIIVPSQGSTQILPNGNFLIGWGAGPYYSEYAAPGNTSDNPGLNLLYDAQMPGGNSSYRAYRDNWVGNPYYPPSIAARTVDGQTTIYASWNGSTETASWQVYGGAAPASLSLLTTAAKSGFETAISVAAAGPYFQVKALGNQGQVLGISKITRLPR